MPDPAVLESSARRAASAPVAPPDRAGAAERLRVAFLAGGLWQGGAEKQVLYMARALRALGADVLLLTLAPGQRYDEEVARAGIPLVPIPRGLRARRLAAISRAVGEFRPHVLQAAHFYVNLHVAIVARLHGLVSIGCVRNDGYHELDANRLWGRAMLRVPRSLIVNSRVAERNACALGRRPDTVHVLPNVIDVGDFDARMLERVEAPLPPSPVAIAAGRLVAQKRLDRFVRAVAALRRQRVAIRGVIAGDGPDRLPLERLARGLAGPDAIRFLGRRDDLPALLSRADFAVLTSDHEGFPNVLLEAMAASLPVISTPAGDAGVLVRDDITGYLVPFEDEAGLAARMADLAGSPARRRRLGRAGRQLVSKLYGFEGLGTRLLELYRTIAAQQANGAAMAVLSA
jgi:glycosyltransferase involved in cell wall biosynthesis